MDLMELRKWLIQKCSWVEDMNELYMFFAEDSSKQNATYTLYALYRYIIFGEQLPYTKTAKELRNIILYYGGAYRQNIENFVKSPSPIKTESIKRIAAECERVGNMKLYEINDWVLKEVIAWSNSRDERFRKASSMTIEEFAKSRIWEEIARDPRINLKNISFTTPSVPVTYMWRWISEYNPLYYFLKDEILRVLKEAGLALKDTSSNIVEEGCWDIKKKPKPC